MKLHYLYDLPECNVILNTTFDIYNEIYKNKKRY